MMQSYDDLSRFMVFGIQPVERVQALPALLRGTGAGTACFIASFAFV